MDPRDPRDSKQTLNPMTRPKAGVDVVTSGDVALVSVAGLVDENFSGFGNLGDATSAVINVSGMTRMTSFGVRQWLKGMDALPKTIGDIYLLGCPTFFVDQLNMVLNFGGAAQILTVVAPYTCPSCGVESGEMIDVLAERAALARGGVGDKECTRCGGKLEFDETPESYFSFVNKYAASSIQPSVAQLLLAQGLYTAAVDSAAEKPPRIIKLVHGSVTYFRIIGTVGSMFKARPFLVGAEGEVVIDLAEVDRFDPLGQREWRRLLKTLARQVPAVTLVDVTESFLAVVGDSFNVAKNISVWSVLGSYTCIECGRTSSDSQSLEGARWPLVFSYRICSTCGGTRRNESPPELLAVLQGANTSAPPASAKVVNSRAEILSRALTDANVAQAGEGATALLGADDTILGKYKIVRRLSAGGMAEVFLANQIGIGGFEKPVALKRIQRQLLETRHLAVDMFLNEAKIAGRLTHPNIVQVLDVGEVGGALYLAMEYVRGKDLRDVIKKLRANRMTMPLGIACYIARELAQALHYAYWSTDMTGKRLGVVHRDVSPHNIILSYDGAVKLLDFGVAMSDVTEQSEAMIVGKWHYMSPEHTTSAQVDHRSDLFSLGVIVYLLFTGTMPFVGGDQKEVVKKIRAGQFVPLQQCAPDLPQGLATLVGRLLSPNPQDRPQTGHEVASSLTEITRTYGIESSPANIAYFLSEVFANERETAIVEIVRAPDPARADIEEPTKLGPGAEISAPQPLDEKSPGSIPLNSLSPGSIPSSPSLSLNMPNMSTSFPAGGTRTPFPGGVDVSMSLASRRSSQDISAQIPKLAATAPVPKITSGVVTRSVIIATLIVLLAVIAYVLVRPK